MAASPGSTVPVISDLLRVNWFANPNGINQIGIMRMDYYVSGITGGGRTLDYIAQSFYNTTLGLLVAMWTLRVNFYGVEVRLLSTPSAAPGHYPNPTSLNAGTYMPSIAEMPYQAACVLTKRTGKIGRAMRGRMYFPFAPVEAIDATTGNVSSAYQTLLQAFCSNIVPGGYYTLGDSGNVVSLTPVVVHGKHLPYTSDEVLSLTPSGRIGTQRRRGQYGRQNTIPPW